MNNVIKSTLVLALFSVISTTGTIAGDADETSKTANAGDQISVELVGTPPSEGEQKEVIKALQKLLIALAHRDLNEVGACLSPDVTIFDGRTHKFLHGKEAVLEHVKVNLTGKDSNRPVKQLQVHDPFVDVKGETAMVSFRATKELGGTSSTKMESWCSEIFERKDGDWLVLQLNTNWNVVK